MKVDVWFVTSSSSSAMDVHLGATPAADSGHPMVEVWFPDGEDQGGSWVTVSSDVFDPSADPEETSVHIGGGDIVIYWTGPGHRERAAATLRALADAIPDSSTTTTTGP